MISIGAWKYRNVLEIHGGPVARISSKLVSNTNGKAAYQCLAYLTPKLRVEYDNSVYGNADGTGTADSQLIASHKAISEALERWAFYSNATGQAARKFGFDIEPTTAGMAAFPGFFSFGARKLARFEAMERWSLSYWWERCLPGEMLHDGQAIEINTPWNCPLVIVWSRRKFWTYGFACRATREEATEQALIELQRNEQVLNCFFELPEPPSKIPLHERRLLHFSSEEGHAQFLDRCFKSTSCAEKPEHPKLTIDAEIFGPWSKYTTVWRCLFSGIGTSHLEEDVSYFLF